MRRIVALFIDWITALLIAALLTGTSPWGADRVDSWVPLVVFLVEVSLLIGLLGFTIGKRLTRLRVIDVDGRPPGLRRALIRTVLLCLVVPAVIMTEDKRGLHDLAAGTKVVPA